MRDKQILGLIGQQNGQVPDSVRTTFTKGKWRVKRKIFVVDFWPPQKHE